ncbi:MAG: rRNA methyltransferase [Firmicutes bacterium]|nr:rRNA methyltransferase [Bacillota bacterium]
MDSARKTAVEILSQVLKKKAYSNIALGKGLDRSSLDPKDKALVTEIVYGTLKYKHTIDTVLSHFLKNGLRKIDEDVLNILRISVYQIRYLDKIPQFAVVNEAVELAKKKSSGAGRLVNGILRNYLRNPDASFYDESNPIEKLCFEYSFPEWLVRMFILQYSPAEAENILRGLNMRPAVTVRVNTLKTTYEDAMEALKGYGYDVTEGQVCPEAIIINKGRNIEDNPLFSEGLISVQDESAMLVAPAMDLHENMKVLDLCSAPGGKTCHMAEIMNNTGRIQAFDLHENKLKLIEENTGRLGITNVVCSKLDASKYTEKLTAAGDRVLIDVPCSGIGIIRKKPEIKWTKDIEGTTSLIDIQRKIMANASKYTKAGGKLIYSTCTLNKDENEENIKWFLKKNPQYSVEPLFFGKFDNVIYHKEGYVTILPNENMDGFFIAKMKKR